jgi:hypothetical protein
MKKVAKYREARYIKVCNGITVRDEIAGWIIFIVAVLAMLGVWE